MKKIKGQSALPVVPEKMFYKIRDVAKIADVKPHVLRYWESEFTNLRPKKNRNGQRVYTRKDIDTVLAIKGLLHEEKYSIAGARLFFKKKRGSVSNQQPKTAKNLPESNLSSNNTLHKVRGGLMDLLDTMDG